MKTVKALVTFAVEVDVEIKAMDTATLKEIEDCLYNEAEKELPLREDEYLDWVRQSIIIKELKEI